MELIRKKLERRAWGLTMPLITSPLLAVHDEGRHQ